MGFVVMAGLLLAACGPLGATHPPAKYRAAAPPATTSTTTGSTSLPPGLTGSAPAGTFAPLVRQVMRGIARTATIPLEAPLGALGPFVAEPQSGQPLGAWIDVNQDGKSYRAVVGYCPMPSPWRAVADRHCDGSVASEVAGFTFGGRAYPSRQTALAAVAPPAAPAGGRTPVDLGAGIQAGRYPGGGGTLVWRDGDWQMVVDAALCAAGGSSHPALPTARAVAAFLHAHPLPPTPGSFVFRTACGDASSTSTTVAWALGPDVYRVATSGYNFEPALRLAVAMRVYS